MATTITLYASPTGPSASVVVDAQPNHRFSYDIASATFALPGGELIKVKRLWTGHAVVVTAMVYRYWVHSQNRWAKADTLDHAIYCATELTREDMIAKAKKELDAQEESA